MIHIDDLQALKRWILQALRKFSVSNPTVLATYTISVVNRGESSLEQLRKSCLDELETFLKGQTSRFVDLLMDALAGTFFIIFLKRSIVLHLIAWSICRWLLPRSRLW